MLHVDIPTHAQMESLIRARRAGSVSIYVPTTPVTTDVPASRIDFRNATDEALGQLRDDGFDKRELAALEAHLRDLAEDDEFWKSQAHSLAVFATPEHVVTFRLGNRLSRTVEVSDRFHTKGLFRAITFPQTALVLALATGSVRLVEIGPDLPPETVRVPGLPKDAADAVGKASITDRTGPGRIQGSEGQKVLMTQYARAVARAIAPFVLATDAPLLLAATDPIATVYRGVDGSATLALQGIDGSPEGMSDAQLSAAARPVLDALYAAQLDEVRDAFATRRAQGRAGTDLVQVARAATVGAVDTLLVDMDAAINGTVDEETGAIEPGAGDARDYGVVDELARRTYLAGGRVLAVRAPDIPDGASLAAILRYPV